MQQSVLSKIIVPQSVSDPEKAKEVAQSLCTAGTITAEAGEWLMFRQVGLKMIELASRMMGAK